MANKLNWQTISTESNTIGSNWKVPDIQSIPYQVSATLSETLPEPAMPAASERVFNTDTRHGTLAYRRRTLGDRSNIIDAPGVWLHFETSAAGVPRNPQFIYVDDEVRTWKYIDAEEVRMIERLPRTGVFVFIY
jgi:hypothetical protein